MRTELLIQKRTYNHRQVTKEVMVSYKPQKRFYEPQIIILGDCITLSVKASCSPSGALNKAINKPTALSINRSCDIDGVYFSKLTKSWGYYALFNGQFYTEDGYRTPKNAKRYHNELLRKLLLNEEEVY